MAHQYFRLFLLALAAVLILVGGEILSLIGLGLALFVRVVTLYSLIEGD